MKQEVFDYIYEYLTQRLQYVRASKHDIRCRCPFHGGDNATSFRVCFSKDEPFFNCWSCHEGGDLVKLISFLDNISWHKALHTLHRQTNYQRIDLDTVGKRLEKLSALFKKHAAKAHRSPVLPVRAENQRPMFEYLESRAKRYHHVLKPEYIVNRYQLYYCNSGRMAGRIIMPLYINGALITYNDRSIDQGAKNKSLHPIGAEFGDIVYGLDQALGKRTAIVVEGAFDAYQIVSAFQQRRALTQEYGAVVLMNNQITDGKLVLIAENFDRAVVLLDHDQGGVSMMKEVCEKLDEMMPTFNATTQIPREKDPGKCTAGQLIHAVKHAEPMTRAMVSGIDISGMKL